MTGSIPDPRLEAATKALVRHQSNGLCDENFPEACSSCDCFHAVTKATTGHGFKRELEQVQAVLAAADAADEASGVRRVTAQELADNAAEAVSGISAMISGSYPPGLDAEAHMWRRHQKVSNEAGEVLDAIEGAIGENPRKGVTKTWGDVDKELLDTAVAALGAYEFNHGNDGSSVSALFKHAAFIHERLSAAITAADSPVGGVS